MFPLAMSRFAAPLLLASLSMFQAPAQALEGGAPVTPFGVMDFGAGILPPATPAGAFGVRATMYHATRLDDAAGKRSPVTLDLDVDTLGLAYIRMTDQQWLGGRYGWSAVLPYFEMKADLGVPLPSGVLRLHGRSHELGDVQISPVILAWTPAPGLFVNASLALQLPSGSYDAAAVTNAGVNHWTVSPTLAFSWIGAGGAELSSNLQLNFHARNAVTDYRSGNEYQHEFALGQHAGPWTVGMGGYLSHQFTRDRQAGQAIDGSQARATAIGPALSFFQPGSGLPLVTLHAYREISAHQRSQGSQVAMKLAWAL